MSSMALGREDLRDTRALAHKLYTQCRDASSVFKSLNTILRKFRNILEEIEDAFDDGETIGTEKNRVIERVIKGRYILLKLDLALQHYRGSSANQQNPSATALADLFTSIEVCTNNVSNAFYAMGRTEQNETQSDPLARIAAQSPRFPSLSVTSSDRGHIPSVVSSNWSSGNASEPPLGSTATDFASVRPSIDLGRSQSDDKQINASQSTLFHSPASSTSALSAEWRSPFAFMDPLSVPLEDASSFILADGPSTAREEGRASISSAQSSTLLSFIGVPKTTPVGLDLDMHGLEDAHDRKISLETPISPNTEAKFEYQQNIKPPNWGINEVQVGGEEEEKPLDDSPTSASQFGNVSDPNDVESDDMDQTIVLAPSLVSQSAARDQEPATLSRHFKFDPTARDALQSKDGNGPTASTAQSKAVSSESIRNDARAVIHDANAVDSAVSAEIISNAPIHNETDVTPRHIEKPTEHQVQDPQYTSIEAGGEKSNVTPCLRSNGVPALPEAPRDLGSMGSIAGTPSISDPHEQIAVPLPPTELPPVPPKLPKRSPPAPPPPRKPTKEKIEIDVPAILTKTDDTLAAPSSSRYKITNPSPQSPHSTASTEELYSSSRPASPVQSLSATLKPEPLRIRSNSGVSITFNHVGYRPPGTDEQIPSPALMSSTPVTFGLRRSNDIPRSPRAKIISLAQNPGPVHQLTETINVKSRTNIIALSKLDRADSSRAPETSSFIERVKSRNESDDIAQQNDRDHNRQMRGFYEPENQVDAFESFSSFDMEKARQIVICDAWNRGAYSEAYNALSEYATHLITSNGNNHTLRRVHHLLGVIASLRGAYEEAIPFFLAALKSPIQDIGDLDSGDFAAAYWLGDCYALTNQRKEALLAYSIVERSPLYQEPRQPRLPSLIKAEQSFCEIGVSRADFAQDWAKDPQHDEKTPPTSILDTRIITAATARLSLETAPRRTLDLQSACATTRSRAFTLQSLHVPGTPLPLRGYRDHKVFPSMFQSGSVWPMLYDPFFAIGNVARGRLLAYECNLETVYGADSKAHARVPKSGPVFLSRVDCFTCSDLIWLIRTIRDALTTFDMEWSEVANTLGTWFVVRYPFLEQSVATTHYFAISIFRQSMRSGYGVEICPDGVCSARDTRRDNGMIGDYVKGVHYSEPKRIKKIIRDYLDHAAKGAKGKKKTTYMPPDDVPKPVMPTEPLELHTDPIQPPELSGKPIQPPELCDSGEVLPALPPRPVRPANVVHRIP
ncbi:Hypothetical protein R9X50_00155300 [Acrodontium crateriforme]|uniref:Uncharacterized protein n=1 Tax=Acrodontium crateriforme TaxID=150365 RepID=A0AAQ3M0X8_9PEZI|nr:Hypothetical protein R9X50_00155300 [Acrodontium crateriforme]